MSDVNGSKTLFRTHQGRILAGVCSGAGEYLGVDANLVRVVFAILTIFTGGVPGVLLYLAAWVLIPEEGEKSSIAENMVNKSRQP